MWDLETIVAMNQPGAKQPNCQPIISKPEVTAHPKSNAELLNALKGLFEHCTMIHKHWGENNNQRESDAAIRAAREALTKAETN